MGISIFDPIKNTFSRPFDSKSDFEFFQTSSKLKKQRIEILFLDLELIMTFMYITLFQR